MEMVFESRTDEQTYTSILATIDENKKYVTFKYNGKNYKRKFSIHKHFAGFHFKGWFFAIDNKAGV